MHPYAYAHRYRRQTILGIMLASVAITLGLYGILSAYGLADPYAWIASPTALGLFGTTYHFYDRRLWRCGLPFSRFRMSSVPDLRGSWVGSVRTSDAVVAPMIGDKQNAVFTIEQTWRQISIEFEGTTSMSRSLMAHLNSSHNGQIELLYMYFAEAKDFVQEPDFPAHYGVARLRLDRLPDRPTLHPLSEEGRPLSIGEKKRYLIRFWKRDKSSHSPVYNDVLTGSYFTGQRPQHVGELELKRSALGLCSLRRWLVEAPETDTNAGKVSSGLGDPAHGKSQSV